MGAPRSFASEAAAMRAERAEACVTCWGMSVAASKTYGAQSLSRGGNAALWEADATKVQRLQAGSRASPGGDYEYLRSAVVRDGRVDRETEQRQNLADAALRSSGGG